MTGGTGAAGAAGAAATGSSSDEEQLRRLLDGMDLARKVGQLFVTRVYGHRATAPDPVDQQANRKLHGVADAAELIGRYHVGGIIYFSHARNIRDPAQIAALSAGIQRAALARPVPVPVLISIDQEHGTVARIGRPATLLPSAMALGAGGSPADARRAARIAGTELAALGIRQNYAPVADVNTNPANPVIGVRSFGSDPQAVAALVAAQVHGYRAAAVAATAKHFPGHGDTATDSHTGLPVLERTRAQWEALDEPPFAAAVRAGVGAVMTAHIVVPALDPSGDPATLSQAVITGLLRERLGHRGVVVTDSLGMDGVREKYSDDEVPVRALLAGCDQLLNPPRLPRAHQAVMRAVETGRLTEERVDESVLRILRLKQLLGLFDTTRTDPQAVGTPAHREAADRIAERTTTVLTNQADLLPLSPATHPRLLVTGADPASPTGTTGPPTTVLAQALAELGFTASTAGIARAVAAAPGHDALLVCTYNVTEASAQRGLVDRLVATGIPVITLALRNPCDIAHLDGVTASLAAYSWSDTELRAAARVLTGAAAARGRLPVPVPPLFPLGHGLSYPPR
ncbi:glycoside hydrolase family 3 protein [Streptomyces sp. NBC_00555]|uniref:glycoside hydrolase family 3 protein n=1 Tax=Streptomyces sp. NBC_00555 TaxID=2903662 RepID=UPI0022564C46|nr:glycoside hydrolase family 3 protein [Streptomyces sp. NBC_00555]MCX5015566.1 glycoside hydrolase family 3 protein [Streptomyces sp. NBC_00555]